MSDYTKVNVRKDLYELIKIKAAADDRSVTKYIERLLRADVTDVATTDPDTTTAAVKSAKNSPTNISKKGQ